MAIVVYKCDTCKREIELQRNIEGLEHVGRCKITHGCRGKLYQTKVFPDYIRGSLPDPVDGLDDWTQRKILHNHTQAIERQIWTINHNMGIVPIVSAYVERLVENEAIQLEEIIPDSIVIVNDNTLQLIFDRPRSGIAQLIGRQSDPDFLKPFVRVQEEQQVPIQISNNAEITIATKVTSFNAVPSITLYLNYDGPAGTVTIAYEADDQPALTSVWSGSDKVVIKGAIYTIRSFNALALEMVTGAITSGSTFTFDRVSYDTTEREIEPKEMYLLLGTSPFDSSADRVMNQIIDVTDVDGTNVNKTFFYDTGEFFATENTLQTIYPQLRTL